MALSSLSASSLIESAHGSCRGYYADHRLGGDVADAEAASHAAGAPGMSGAWATCRVLVVRGLLSRSRSRSCAAAAKATASSRKRRAWSSENGAFAWVDASVSKRSIKSAHSARNAACRASRSSMRGPGSSQSRRSAGSEATPRSIARRRSSIRSGVSVVAMSKSHPASRRTGAASRQHHRLNLTPAPHPAGVSSRHGPD